MLAYFDVAADFAIDLTYPHKLRPSPLPNSALWHSLFESATQEQAQYFFAAAHSQPAFCAVLSPW
jgi:hypothetical protein